MSTLKIENLHVSVGEKEILKGINLTINTGETHAIMGPNGNGNLLYYQLLWDILNIQLQKEIFI